MIAEAHALLRALAAQGFPMSDEAWRNAGDEAPANAQASREVRALHRATVAFAEALKPVEAVVSIEATRVSRVAEAFRDREAIG